MKKMLKNLLILIFSAVIVMCAFPVSSMAYNYKDVYREAVLPANVFTALKGEGDAVLVGDDFIYTHTYYKITVPAGSCYVKLECKNTNEISVCRKVKANKYEVIKECQDNNEYYFVLPKGDYYLNADYDNEVRFTTKSYKNGKNYSRLKAAKLAKGKTVVFSDANGAAFDRYYKITIKKKQKLTIYPLVLGGGYYSDWEVNDSKGGRVSFTGSDKTAWVSYKPVKAGTYIIRVHYCMKWSGNPFKYPWNVRTLRWK